MATTAKTKKATETTTANKATTSRSKKSDTLKQIENLEKALENVKDEDVTNLVPEEIKADIEADKETADALETPKDVDFDAEVKKIIDTAEASEEVKEQFEDFEAGKEKFNENIEKEPEKTEELVQEEIKRIEALKKKAEATKAKIQHENKKRLGNEGFTNWWNGSSGLY